jgi:mRNA-degrading endonuclease RelE of RelBE toxin-antitoxin system
MSSSNQAKTFIERARERAEDLRRREAERYEALLRERFREHYPNLSPEQKRKIEARVQTLVERHGATFGPRDAIEMPPLRRFEEQLRVRLATRYPDLSPDQSKRLQERIAQAVEKQKGRIVQTRRHSLDNARSALGRAPGSQQREAYER